MADLLTVGWPAAARSSTQIDTERLREMTAFSEQGEVVGAILRAVIRAAAWHQHMDEQTEQLLGEIMQAEAAPECMDTVDIDQLERVAFCADGDHPSSCSICLGDFGPENVLTRLPCSANHVFHPSCIRTWLGRSVQCPLCRADLRSEAAIAARPPPQLRQFQTLPSVAGLAASQAMLRESRAGLLEEHRIHVPERLTEPRSRGVGLGEGSPLEHRTAERSDTAGVAGPEPDAALQARLHRRLHSGASPMPPLARASHFWPNSTLPSVVAETRWLS